MFPLFRFLMRYTSIVNLGIVDLTGEETYMELKLQPASDRTTHTHQFKTHDAPIQYSIVLR
jgi:hypothetical protein